MCSFKDNISTVSQKINKVNSFFVGILVALLILDVWLAVLDRYIFHWQLSWVEELARYIMIWAILLAVPCCTANKEHMGLGFVVNNFSASVQRAIKIFMGLLFVLFFSYIAYAGIAFVQKGASQYSSIFGIPMSYAYAAIPVTFLLSALQAFLIVIQDILDMCSTNSVHLSSNNVEKKA